MNKNLLRTFTAVFFIGMALFLVSPVQAVSRSLVLFPLTIYAEAPKPFLRQGLKTMFQSRLAGGGLEVLTEDSYDPLLTDAEKKGNITKTRAEELARKLKADYAVFGSVTTLGGGYSLDLSLLDLTKEPPSLKRVSEAVKEEQFIPGLADVANRFRGIIEGRYVGKRPLASAGGTVAGAGPVAGLFAKLGAPEGGGEGAGFFRPVRQPTGFQPSGRLSLQMTVMGFDVGDLTGDGNRELAVLGRKELRIYGKKGQNYRLKDTLEPSFGEDFLKVSVGDVDGNGKAEIYLVSRYGVRARSTVYEWDGKFRKRHRLPGHLMAVRKSGGARPMLLFQDSKVAQFVGGDIWFMDYGKKGDLVKTSRVPQLKDVRFYTLLPVDLNKDGLIEFMGLGEEDKLRVWDSKGVELWRGKSRIGGTNNAVRLGQSIRGDLPPRFAFDPRSVFTDINGDGKKELIAARNIPLVAHAQDLKIYTKSQVIAYNVQGATLIPGWDTREISYCLVDLQAEGGTLFIAAQKGKGSGLVTGSSRILWFDLQ